MFRYGPQKIPLRVTFVFFGVIAVVTTQVWQVVALSRQMAPAIAWGVIASPSWRIGFSVFWGVIWAITAVFVRLQPKRVRLILPTLLLIFVFFQLALRGMSTTLVAQRSGVQLFFVGCAAVYGCYWALNTISD